jgi:glycosyltransferase involved in cell wall biosynthesis
METKSKGHICIIPAWYPSKERPGYGIFIKEQAEQLDAIGYTVSVLFCTPKKYSTHKIEYEWIKGVHTFIQDTTHLPKLTSWLIRRWAENYGPLFQRLDSKLGKPDLLHAHGYIGGFAAHYLSVLHDIPFILTEHGSNFISDKIHGWHRNKIKKTYKEALALIAVGENLKEAMTKFTDNRILVIPNLVNEVVFNPATTKSQDRFEFLVVGGLIPRKRVGEIIQSVSKAFITPSAKPSVRIIGDGPMRKELERLAKRLELSNQIIFEGDLQLEDVANKMRQSHALITVSETETFGKVIIEALASGTPVLTVESADPENIVIDGINGIKIDSDLKQLPQAMLKMVELAQHLDPSDLHQGVVKKYGKKAVMKQIVTVYETVISTHKDKTDRPTE